MGTQKGEVAHKADYIPWTNFVADLMRLREKFSLTQISNLFGHESGWAANAMRHRPIVSPEDVQKARELVAEHLPQDETNKLLQETETVETKDPDAPSTEQISERAKEYFNKPRAIEEGYWSNDQHRRVEETSFLIGEMKEEHELTWGHTSRLFGMADTSLQSMIRNNEPAVPAQERIDLARSHLAMLRRGQVPPPLQEEWNAPRKKTQSVTAFPVDDDQYEAWAWIEDCVEQLHAIATRIDTEAGRVPAAFRAPYDKLAMEVLELAEKFGVKA